MGIPGPFQLLIVLLLVLLLFGTKRLRSLGSDLGGAIRDFRKGVSDEGDSSKSADNQQQSEKPADPANTDPSKPQS